MDVKIGRTAGADYDFTIYAQKRLSNTDAVKQEDKVSEQPAEQLTEQLAEQPAEQVEGAKTDEEKSKLAQVVEAMTDWVQKLNTDIHFVLHEGTEQLMVQVVDLKEHKVIKEFPPHEFLDMIAKIREYVGILLDKKV